MTGEAPRFRKLSTWLRDRYGERVYKVSLRGGFTCPNRDGTLGEGGCAFCAGDALEPVGFDPRLSVAEQLTRGMAYIAERHGARRFIAYFHDYSATYGPVDRLRELYAPTLAEPRVVGLAVGTRPDCLQPPVLELLSEVRARRDLWVELGLQVASDPLLRAVGRGHTVDDFRRAVEACRERDLRVCAHVILGLPGATIEDERRTAALLEELGVWGVKLHAFHVIRGTRMEAAHARGEAPVLTRAGYVDRAVSMLEHLPARMVVHRLTGEAPRHLTVAPAWTVNKLAAYDAVVAALAARNTRQGRALSPPAQQRTAT